MEIPDVSINAACVLLSWVLSHSVITDGGIKVCVCVCFRGPTEFIRIVPPPHRTPHTRTTLSADYSLELADSLNHHQLS